MRTLFITALLQMTFFVHGFATQDVQRPIVILAPHKKGALHLRNCIQLLMKHSSKNIPKIKDSNYHAIFHTYDSNRRQMDQYINVLSANCKVIAVTQDPRDLILFFLSNIDTNKLYLGGKDKLYSAFPEWVQMSRYDKLNTLIQAKGRDFSEAFNQSVKMASIFKYIIAPHAPADTLLFTKIEDLVRAKSRSQRLNQIQTLSKLAHFLGLKISKRSIESIERKLNQLPKVFEEEQVGQWKKALPQELREKFKIYYQYDLEWQGYAKDRNW